MVDPPVGVVLCHEVWGVTAALRAAAARLRRAGLLVRMPDLYGGRSTSSYPAAAALRAGLGVGDIHGAVSQSLRELAQSGARRTAVVGYSMGGSIALWAATALEIDQAVTVYGGGLRRSYWSDMPAGIDLAPTLTRPWIGFYGGRDTRTTPADLHALTCAAAAAPMPGHVMIYPDADHGFALDPADARHDVGAAADLHARVMATLLDPPG